MSTTLNPYLSFRDNAKEAMTFYQSVFGGTLESSTFADMNMAEDPSEGSKIMHSSLTTDDGLVIMASDTPSSMNLDEGSSYSISISGDDGARLRGYWDKLLDGGQMTMPLEKAPWGDVFGMLTDKFGTSWMISIETEDSQR